MARYESRVIPVPVFKAAIDSGDHAIYSLLSGGMSPEQVASLAGHRIDHIWRELEEEKQKAEAKAARKVTATEKLLAREAKRKRRQ